MSSLKNFAELKSLGQQLKQQQEAHKIAQALRAQQERQARLEADIFRSSIGTVVPVKVAEKHSIPARRPAPLPFHHLADEQAALQESLSDDFDADTLLETDGDLSYSRPGVGADVVRKLRKGHWSIQAQLDLHGLRRDEARDALGEFLRKCARNGTRCVRIIHGKGLGSVNKEPVLKHKVRNWLIQTEEIVAFSQATAADGGAGALIVLLQA
ncbi:MULTISPECIES: Smr/MutS family protein [unclassified Undibacterium]|uniref:Smr/MutS family protein n=1 Tax=unclassified Undibacterium TaxID=2630295 RepID=UPI002AC99700|nr:MULTISPECIES: Smr/MutS family protein [unclassified Undibacterium]MEB0140363.1 Smr/MutS family protein [Undibacterium sp. CCC2.1]MEB0173392.1 Smr/MutS family protein [Undibacterium sp. CCC1.1]MEB0176789.1 Smr/MutS family protein [Undibacterium sp. CCC3.4]MEB0216554.1 Smr/MutS family protein [Undibacterium sp. 5I2]WPX43390.1 Smr/MutS family protein [Undibacterium sp. CCC3.4]